MFWLHSEDYDTVGRQLATRSVGGKQDEVELEDLTEFYKDQTPSTPVEASSIPNGLSEVKMEVKVPHQVEAGSDLVLHLTLKCLTCSNNTRRFV